MMYSVDKYPTGKGIKRWRLFTSRPNPEIPFSSQCKLSALTRIQLVTLLVLMACAFLSSGCSTTHYQRMIYDALRQQDCIINQLDSFCTRTFALDFYDYTALRNDYLRSLVDQPFTSVTENDSDSKDLVTVMLNPNTSQ